MIKIKLTILIYQNKADDNKANKPAQKKHKAEVQDTNNITSKEIDKNLLTDHLKIESKLKGIIENFINQEIKKKYFSEHFAKFY